MRLPDVNLAIYAYDLSSPFHESAMSWWQASMNGEEVVGIAPEVALAFVRITTNARIPSSGFGVNEAIDIVESWLDCDNVTIIHPTANHLEFLRRLLNAAGGSGPLTSDAHLASLPISHDATIYSNDQDFLRFPGLRVVNPLIPA